MDDDRMELNKLMIANHAVDFSMAWYYDFLFFVNPITGQKCYLFRFHKHVIIQFTSKLLQWVSRLF